MILRLGQNFSAINSYFTVFFCFLVYNPKYDSKSAITDCYRFKLPIKKIELGLDY